MLPARLGLRKEVRSSGTSRLELASEAIDDIEQSVAAALQRGVGLDRQGKAPRICVALRKDAHSFFSVR